MKFDEVYEFVSREPGATKLTKLELALYYLSEIYRFRYRTLRLAEIDGLSTAEPYDELSFEPKFKDQIEFSRDDIIDYLVSEGSKFKR